jgi:hypothetical protein
LIVGPYVSGMTTTGVSANDKYTEYEQEAISVALKAIQQSQKREDVLFSSKEVSRCTLGKLICIEVFHYAIFQLIII